MVFLPIAYDKGWTCTVNGNPTEIVEVLDSFMGVKVPVGNANTVTLTFRPDGFNTGLCLTIISAFLLAVSLYIARTKLWKEKVTIGVKRAVGVVVYNFYIAVFFALIAVLYIAPVLWSVIQKLFTVSK
jgi:hypothetical protein